MKAKPKKTISPFEWDMLVGAWRYYEHRATAASATFPFKIVGHYFRGAYEEEDCERIARQFVKEDHARNGEGDWFGENDCDRETWSKFYAFLKAYLDGWEDVCGFECFYCEATGRHYPKEKYITFPSVECWVDPKDNEKEAAE